ncbi:DNA mismatch repair endonuclease MutL, partial [Pseudomonas sp.]|uniref:DNA mismatch repair endonuclease MutL n=2 Tax=unclassified Pseudomonas TaxID=196821 RepID=UPI0028AD429B
MSGGSRIQLLSPRLANQIAAGEVVERPASVAKELLENSLDSGARRIDVEVEQGGVKLLRVRDDGGGISADDLPLALARHATSKIRELEDLEGVLSLGFRGEALASISSVARLTLTSRTANASEAWQVETEGRDMTPRVQPAAHPVGTSVEVRDLFFNTPARRKFLKAEKTEFDHLQEVIRRLALARFDVGFHLRHNGKSILSLHEAHDETARARRVGAICGPGFMEQALPIDVERNGLRLWGWVGLPTFSRSQADLQYFFVNGRAVRDKLVAHAVRQAYRDVLFNGRHPTFVLFLELEPNGVDVNVHPTKHEVRFREGRSVHDFLYGTLHRALADVRPEDQLAAPAAGAEIARPSGQQAGEFGPQGEMRLASPVLEQPQAPQFAVSNGGSGAGYQYQYTPRPSQPLPAAESQAVYREFYKPLSDGAVAPAALPESQGDIPPLGYALAQLKGIYILAENAVGLVLVDMHAAHERIMYERLKVAMASEGLSGQPLLVPETLALSQREADCAEEHGQWFQRLGFELQRLGPETLAIRQIPALLKQAEANRLVQDVLADLMEYGTSDR